MSVERIGDNVFSGCNLKNVTTPEHIGLQGVLQDDERSSITNIVVLEGSTNICAEAFRFCYSLKSVTIPDSVTSIGHWAFECCGLPEVRLPSGLAELGCGVFEYGCLTNIPVFPPRITAIPDSTFAFNTDLVSVTIPNGIVSIGHYAFQNYLNLMDITIPDSITTIGSRAFQGNCLTNVTLGTNVRDIGIYAFFGNPIENVTIPATVENLSGSRAFGGCDLSSVLILGNVDGLTGIFDYCCNLKKIILLGDITHKYNEELGVVYDEGIEYLYFDEVGEDLVVYVTPACTCQLLGDNPVKVVSQTTANVIGGNCKTRPRRSAALP